MSKAISVKDIPVCRYTTSGERLPMGRCTGRLTTRR